VHDRLNPGRVASETCITTRVRRTLCNFQVFSSPVGTKSLVAGQPGQPLFICSLGARFLLKCFREQSLRCTVIWSIRAVSL